MAELLNSSTKEGIHSLRGEHYMLVAVYSNSLREGHMRCDIDYPAFEF